MTSIMSALLSYVAGVISRPYLGQYFKSSELRYNNLEKAYVLSDKIYLYAMQILQMNLLTMHYLQTNNFERGMEEIKKITPIKNPFSKLKMIFDFRLNAPSHLVDEIIHVQQLIMLTMRPIAESISQPIKRGQLALEAAEKGLEATTKAQDLQVKLMLWIKEEKIKIQSASDPVFMLAKTKDFFKKHILTRLLSRLKPFRIISK